MYPSIVVREVIMERYITQNLGVLHPQHPKSNHEQKIGVRVRNKKGNRGRKI